jgi:acyl carrier protein
MGLDSVELIIEVEKYFKIQIPDPEAEKIYIVKDMVDTVAKHLNIHSNETPLLDTMFSNVSSAIQTTTKTKNKIQLTDKISNYLSINNKEKWDELEKFIKLKVPRPDNYNPYSTKLSDKFKRLISWTPDYDWRTISFEQFVNAICANNYLTLLEPGKINNKHEIYIGVMGITVEKIGVDYFEILPDKSFTNDLGVD